MAIQNQSSHKHILLADDDIDDRSLLSELLQEADASVMLKSAEDGKQLLELLHASEGQIPDMIFLDINMPRINGLECLTEIRNQSGSLQKVPVIILSTSGDPLHVKNAFQLGADAYAVKPYSMKTGNRL